MVSGTNYIKEEILTKDPRRIPTSFETVHMQHIPEDFPTSKSSLATEEYTGYYLWRMGLLQGLLCFHLPMDQLSSNQNSPGRQAWNFKYPHSYTLCKTILSLPENYNTIQLTRPETYNKTRTSICWNGHEKWWCRQTTSCRNYREQALNNLHQQENESIADLWLIVLLDKWNYNHCCMSTQKVDLFIHSVKYFAIRSWTREWWADLAYDWLLDNAKSHKAVLAEYNYYKESRQDSNSLPSNFSAAIDAVSSNDSYNQCSF